MSEERSQKGSASARPMATDEETTLSLWNLANVNDATRNQDCASPTRKPPSSPHNNSNKPASMRKRKLGSSSSTTRTASGSGTTTGTAPEADTTSDTDVAAAATAASAQQPEGWRVKLYRLNADGSWDDCGTGRIVCLYRQPPPSSSPPPSVRAHLDDDGTSTGNNTGTTDTSNETTTTASAASHNEAAAVLATTAATSSSSSDLWLYAETGEATLCVQAEMTSRHRQPRVLLRTRILLRDAYQRQGDNIITWTEPGYDAHDSIIKLDNNTMDQPSGGGGGGVDLALSFQDNAGCLDIWRQITQVQSRAAELLREHHGTSSVEDLAAQVAARHHADLQSRHSYDVWNSNESEDMDMALPSYGSMLEAAKALPHPPTTANLEEVADVLTQALHTHYRESLAMWIANDDCAYLKALLSLFAGAEAHHDYASLAALAGCVKTVLLMNDPSILELIVNDAAIFEEVCSVLEYDPDLREKANHRWFLRERAKFRTVVPMDDAELVAAIHRSFRVNYLRDTLLRPTMDESSLNTLSSLMQFTHADVVKGVTWSGDGQPAFSTTSYLVRVIRMLGVEFHTLCMLDWLELETHPDQAPPRLVLEPHEDMPAADPSIVMGTHAVHSSATWKQYLAPQDGAPSSRRLRRRGCVSFLRELFNMVRLSLQQEDREAFFPAICTLEIDLRDDQEISDNISQTSQNVEVGSMASTTRSSDHDKEVERAQRAAEKAVPTKPTHLLSILGNVLSDPTADVTETGAVLEIIAGIAMHDPNLIRRHCLAMYHGWQQECREKSDLPTIRCTPHDTQVLFLCLPNDLLGSLLFQLAVQTDAGILLQGTEILRIILDADVVTDHTVLGPGFTDEAEGLPPGVTGAHQHQAHDAHTEPLGLGVTSSDQKQFLSMFYESYVQWLGASVRFTVLYTYRRVPDAVLRQGQDNALLQSLLNSMKQSGKARHACLNTTYNCPIRSSFAVETLTFCVRAHLYRMKFFLLKNNVLDNVLDLLSPLRSQLSADRCLKLALLRFLRAILAVNDEFYYRYIIERDLFAPVFEAFRANPVGDNLVSSAVVEMCDYIHSENITSLLEYIVTKHLALVDNTVRSLEDVSSPYVSTLTILRNSYEANLNAAKRMESLTAAGGGESRYFGNLQQHHDGGAAPSSRLLSGRALEDQRKFLEVDDDEAYFESDNENNDTAPPTAPTTSLREGMQELHRTPRMFSLHQQVLDEGMPELPSDDEGSTKSSGAGDM